MSNNNLSRQLTLSSLITYYISTIVGVGIFLVPIHATKTAGPASLISWCLVLLMIYPFALIFAHISRHYQVSGSIQKFIEEGAGKKFGKSAALFVVISAMFGNFLLGHTSAQYINELFSIEDRNLVLPVAVIFLFFSSLFNLLNLGISSKIQTVSLLALITILVILVILSIPNYNPNYMIPFVPHGYNSIFAAILVCFYSVVGWENVDSIAEEVEHPNKTYKAAIKYSLAFIAIFYLSIALTVIMVIPPEKISSKNTVLSILLSEAFGAEASKAGSIIAIVLLFLGANAWILGTSRMIFALARDKVIPSSISNIHHSSKIPLLAVMVQMPFYIILALIISVTQLSDQKLVEIASLNYLMLYMIVFFCGLKSFTTRKLKTLSGISLVVSTTLIIYSSNELLYFSLTLALICFVYVYFYRRKIIYT